MITDVVKHFVEDIAEDWSVKIRTEGGGSADSGFKLVVEQSDNLTLRETQGQYFQDSLQHLYDVLRKMYPELTEGMLVVDFAPPSLPVNTQEQVNQWDADNPRSNLISGTLHLLTSVGLRPLSAVLATTV
jgi:hypothetical protein